MSAQIAIPNRNPNQPIPPHVVTCHVSAKLREKSENAKTVAAKYILEATKKKERFSAAATVQSLQNSDYYDPNEY